MVDFGKRLKTLRIESGLTQQQVADRIWVNKASISSYELSTRLPSYEVLIKLSKLFNVSTDYLLGIENKVKANSIVDVSGLTEKQIVLLQKLIDELKQ
ncbi:helix-turn-helix transcriptional regulator [uncultured Ruminococcus sp.]|uniref:helix-turn-helix domain-containing protein n=1 Tax=uncultured Ruminococcus sp. TaxID=165186 RepID=UPI00292FF3BA|nr:helix-turn-helix transcriptional regulator [uncultured Ruminococcus sp.]